MTFTECQTLAGPNELCPEGLCVDGYACDSGGSQRCYKQAATGATCNAALAYACASLGEICDPDSSVCVARPEAGQPCLGPQAACAFYTYCNAGTCEALPTVGQDCVNGYCMGNLECAEDGSTCQPLPGPNVCLSF